ncbi:hypothetical protein VPHF99_0082 [Vibrio phage F99]|nr:hypothetical protein MYOV085v1_p0058 [Vibrio phage 355E48.1]
MADNFGTLNPTTASTSDDFYLLRQNGIDYKQSRDTIAAGINNARWLSTADYLKGSSTKGSDGVLYEAVVNTGVTTNNVQDPVLRSDDTEWKVAIHSIGENILVNGGFEEWRYGTSTNTATSGNYYVDRWVNTSSGTCTIAQSNSHPISDGSSLKSIQINSSNTSGQLGIQQRLEAVSVNRYATSFLTVSGSVFVTALGSSVGSIELTLSTPNTEDDWSTSTVTATETAGTAVVGQWVKFSHTFTAPSSIVRGLGVGIALTNTDGTTDINFADIKLESGSVVTPFVSCNPAENLTQCERFYYPPTIIRGIAADSGRYAGGYFAYPTTMRTIPTVRWGANANFNEDILTIGGAVSVATGGLSIDPTYTFYDCVLQTQTQPSWTSILAEFKAEL